MRIIQLEAENVKKLRAVAITPRGNVVQITGPNGAGKSSVLDCIFWALAGKGAISSQPVREGEETAVIRLDLGEIIVTRKFDADGGTSLSVSTVEGAKFSSPQSMLDGLLGTLTFDPLAFSRMVPKDQRQELGRLLGITGELKTLEAQRLEAFSDRTDASRELKAAIAQRDAVVVTDKPLDRVDVARVMAEITEAQAENNAIAEAQHALANLKQRATLIWESARAKRQEAERLIQLAVAEEKEGDAIGQQLLDAPAIRPMVDVEPLRARIVDAQAINAEIDRRAQRAKLDAEVEELQAGVKHLTECITQFEAAKAALVEGAAMPIPDLGFSDDGVTYKGLPLDQASSAEQLRVSVAIAMASNPKLRVLRIKDGSLLDEASLALLESMADDRDYQVWIERVDTSGTVGIIMEDGTAREASAAVPSMQPTTKRRRTAAGV